jgi:hypothetical protein
MARPEETAGETPASQSNDSKWPIFPHSRPSEIAQLTRQRATRTVARSSASSPLAEAGKRHTCGSPSPKEPPSSRRGSEIRDSRGSPSDHSSDFARTRTDLRHLAAVVSQATNPFTVGNKAGRTARVARDTSCLARNRKFREPGSHVKLSANSRFRDTHAGARVWFQCHCLTKQILNHGRRRPITRYHGGV